MSKTDARERLGLRPVINVNGPMTSLGACRALPIAIQAAVDILPCFVEINDLHAKANHVIAKSTGAEAGMVTACASAGITLAVAGAMTGSDLAKIEQLPDTEGMKNEVVIQKGHDIGYGAPIEQSIRLAGARPIHIGNVLETHRYQLEAKLNKNTAAAVYVISFHTVQYGQLPLSDFIDICHKKDVPVIVDMANEQDLHSVLEMGADIVIFSAHKFLRGLTAGIVAGRKDLIQAIFFQNMGIGRGMKVGKESIASTMAVLEAWASRDHLTIQNHENKTLALWQNTFSKHQGVKAEIIPDPTGNPIHRLRLHIDPNTAQTTAWDLAVALAKGEPPIIIREEEVELGHFEMDPCHLNQGEAEIVANRVVAELTLARNQNHHTITTAADRTAAKFLSLLQWPN